MVSRRRRHRRGADAGRLPGRVRPRALRHSRHALHDVHLRRSRLPGRGRASDRPRLQWLGYLAIALGVQTKGPIALVLCGLTMLLLMALSADLRRRLLALHWVLGLLVDRGGVGALVHLHVRALQGRLRQRLHPRRERATVCEQPLRNQPGFWFYFQILAAALLPWTGLLVGRLIDDVRALLRGERLDGVETMLWGWTLAIVGFFTLSTFKLDHYVFPAAPALCLLCARAWSDVRGGPDDAASSRGANRFLSDRAAPARGRRRVRLLPDRAAGICRGARSIVPMALIAAGRRGDRGAFYAARGRRAFRGW